MPDQISIPAEDAAYIKNASELACDCGKAHIGIIECPSHTVYVVISDNVQFTAVPLANPSELRSVGAILLAGANEWELRDRVHGKPRLN